MANNVKKINGKAYWTRILGAPHEGYDPAKRQWSMDVAPDAVSISLLQNLGCESKLKDDVKNSHDGLRYVPFKRMEFKRDSEVVNKTIEVLSSDGKTPWDESVAIGNGSDVTVEFNLFDIPARGRLPATKGLAILKVVVNALVKYIKPEKNYNMDFTPPVAKKKVDSSVETWSN